MMKEVAENLGIENNLFNYVIKAVEDTAYYKLINIKIKSLSKGQASLGVDCTEEHCNPMGIIHGGLLMSLADAAMGNAIRSMGIKGVTVDANFSFLATAYKDESIIAEGKVLKAGKSILFCEAIIKNKEKIIAKSTATFFNMGNIEIPVEEK